MFKTFLRKEIALILQSVSLKLLEMSWIYCYAQKQSPEVSRKKGVLRNFTKFTGKHLCQSLFFRPATLLKKRPCTGFFAVNFVKFLRAPFFKEHLWWLLLCCEFMQRSFLRFLNLGWIFFRKALNGCFFKEEW